MTDCATNPRYSVIIPVYRSGEVLYELTDRLRAFFDARSETFEIVFVEDCGGDNSWEIITELADRDTRVHGIRMSRNFGQHNALLCGIRAARGETIITMDDDLQHPPEELPKLVAKFEQGYDVVYGAAAAPAHGILRGIASWLTRLALSHSMGMETAKRASAWRIFRADARRAFDSFRSPYVNIDVMLTWATNRFAAVEVRHDPRKSGVSGYSFKALIRHAFNMMTGFSAIPLQASSLMGFSLAMFGGLILVYVLGKYLIYGSVVPGFAFLASIVAIFSGAQLLALGIIGEYLARIHFRTMDRPAYVVAESVAVDAVSTHRPAHESGIAGDDDDKS